VRRLLVACLALGAGCASPLATLDDGTLPVEVVDGGADAGDAGFDAGPLLVPLVELDGGRVLTGVRVVTVVASNDDAGSALISFGDALPQTIWWVTFAHDYGLGLSRPSQSVIGPPITANLDASGASAYLDGAVTGSLRPDGNTVYLLYLPSGITFTDAPGACAYHRPYPLAGSTGDSFGLIAQGCPQLLPGESQLSGETYGASHELAESVTDSALGSGWVLPYPVGTAWGGSPWPAIGVEIGDLCNGSRWFEPGAPGLSYQRLYLDSAALAGGDPCIPAIAPPYFNVSIPEQWYAVPGGTSVDISVTGYTTGAISPWTALTGAIKTTGGLGGSNLSASLSSPLGARCQGALINDGVTATLHVSVAAGVGSDNFAVLGVYSEQLSSFCLYAGGTGDRYHLWLVGIYVP